MERPGYTAVAAEPDNPGVIVHPPFLYLGTFLVALLAQWLAPLPILATPAALVLGFVLIAVAVGIANWGRRTMRAAGTNINPARPATTIVTSGPFGFSRNPLYLSLTLLFIGLTLAVNTWWGIVLLLPLLLALHFGVVLREERYLDRKFGADYREYRSRVRRYV
jgi:protein-S-isoprenylcysteine O-methyltransferase Ste14